MGAGAVPRAVTSVETSLQYLATIVHLQLGRTTEVPPRVPRSTMPPFFVQENPCVAPVAVLL